MNTKIDGTISIIVALFLLFSMMLQINTWIMGGVAIVALIVLAVYQFTRKTP